MKQFLLALAMCCLTLPAFAQEKSQAVDWKGLHEPPAAEQGHDHANHAHSEKSCACAHKVQKHPPAAQTPPAFTPSSDFAPAKGCDQAKKQHCQAGHCEKDCKSTECKSCCGNKEAPPAEHAHHH